MHVTKTQCLYLYNNKNSRKSKEGLIFMTKLNLIQYRVKYRSPIDQTFGGKHQPNEWLISMDLFSQTNETHSSYCIKDFVYRILKKITLQVGQLQS